MPTLLICLLVLPLATAIVVGLLGSRQRSLIRWVSLGSTLACLGIATALAMSLATPRIQAGSGQVEKVEVRPEMVTRIDLITLPTGSETQTSIQFFIGLDGLNVWLILLTAFLMVPAVLISWTSIEERANEYYAWLLVLATGMMGVFMAFDVILFYVFFELTLVPLFFLIGIWGGPERQYAARKFFVYTLGGSLITLVGVLGVVITLAQPSPAGKLAENGYKPEMTFSIPRLVTLVDEKNTTLEKAYQAELAQLDRIDEEGQDTAQQARQQWRQRQFWLFLALMVGFAIKVPLVPLHTWLPLAHVEAPTAGSVLLAGVLLKLGTYGFLRLCLPLTPDACVTFGAPLIGWLAVIGIIYGAFCALAQDDIKKLVAYSSVSHLGFAMLGLFAMNEVGLTGSMLQMVNHGLSTGALFLLVGMLYERYHTRKMDSYGGMAARLPLLGFFMVFITMSSIGLPGLNGFVGEVLVLMGMYDVSTRWVSGPILVALACSGIVLGAWYMLNVLRQVFFGPIHEPGHGTAGEHTVKDLNGRELAALVPIAALCLVLGVYPKPFVDTVSPDIKVIARIAEKAAARATK